MQRGGGIGAAERGEADGFGGGLRNIAGRWPDADVILQGGMSEGLRDWDLWGPLIFCLLLSLFLSWGAKGDQKDLVFSGVFAMVWIGEAVVTLQIKLLGGNMYVHSAHLHLLHANRVQCLFPVHLYYRLHALPARHCLHSQRRWHTHDRAHTRLQCSHRLVASSGCEYHGRLRSRKEPRRHRSIPSVCILRCSGLPVLHQLVQHCCACKSMGRYGQAVEMAIHISCKFTPIQSVALVRRVSTYTSTVDLMYMS